MLLQWLAMALMMLARTFGLSRIPGPATGASLSFSALPWSFLVDECLLQPVASCVVLLDFVACTALGKKPLAFLVNILAGAVQRAIPVR